MATARAARSGAASAVARASRGLLSASSSEETEAATACASARGVRRSGDGARAAPLPPSLPLLDRRSLLFPHPAPPPPAGGERSVARRRFLSVERRGEDAPYDPLLVVDPSGSSSPPDPRLADAVVRVRENDYADDANADADAAAAGGSSRSYILLPRTLPRLSGDGTDDDVLRVLKSARLASLHVKGSVIFGARTHAEGLEQGGNFVRACRPLVERALLEIGDSGHQPQAVAALGGLCAWVRTCLAGDGGGGASSAYLTQLREEARGGSEGDHRGESEGGVEAAAARLEAAGAVAAGKPRPGHRVLGAGTFRDARPAWEALAREYASTPGLCTEADLYRSVGGELVGVEWLADTSEGYLRDAGGCMVRFFFI